MVKQTEDALAEGRTDQFGRAQANCQLPHLDLRVTRPGMERAIKFIDMLVRLLEANDVTVTPGTGREPAVIRVDGEQIRVILKEEVRGRKRELTRDEKRNHERWHLSNLFATAAFEKRRRAETEAERREAARLQELRHREQQRIERLTRNAAAWEQAQRMRKYLAAVEEKAAAREGGLETDRTMSRFLQWAHGYSDRLDATGALAGAEWEEDEG